MGNRIEIKMQFRLDSGSGVRRVDQRFQCAHQLYRVQVDTVDMLKEDQMKRGREERERENNHWYSFKYISNNSAGAWGIVNTASVMFYIRSSILVRINPESDFIRVLSFNPFRPFLLLFVIRLFLRRMHEYERFFPSFWDVFQNEKLQRLRQRIFPISYF